MTQNFSSLIKQCCLFFAISVFVSICKNEIILENFPKEYVKIARISSITSTIVGNFTSIALLFVIILTTWYCSILFAINVSAFAFSESCKNLVVALIFGEIFKFLMIWIFLKDEASRFDFENFEKLDIVSQLKKTDFYVFCNYSNILSAIVSIFLFCYSLFQNQIDVKKIILLSIILSVLLSVTILI